MKVKFNLYERVAGLFVLVAMFGALLIGVSVAYKKGWFSSKVSLYAVFESANGLHVGTKVQMSGLRAGSVSSVELQEDNKIKVEFELLEKFFRKIKIDSVVQVARPFIIGEKVVEISVGSVNSKNIGWNQELQVKQTVDIVDLLSGKDLGEYISSMSKLTENFKILMEAFSDKKRFKKLVEVLDDINPLVKNLNHMSKNVVTVSEQLLYKKSLSNTISHLEKITGEVNHFLPQIVKSGPEFALNLNDTLKNLTVLSSEFKKLLPALNAVAPELPRTSVRMLEAVDEVVVTLKAMQKTFFLNSKVEEVQKEEAARKPAAAITDPKETKPKEVAPEEVEN